MTSIDILIDYFILLSIHEISLCNSHKAEVTSSFM